MPDDPLPTHHHDHHRRPRRPLSTFLHARPRVRLAALLSLPVLWLLVIYIVSLAMLLVTAFWTTNTLTSKVEPAFIFDNFRKLWTNDAYRNTALRTITVAIGVTLVSVAFAIPLGLFMAKVASPRLRNFLAMAITLPLWAGYLVKVFAMRISFGKTGPINSFLGTFGFEGPGYSLTAVVLTLTYLWFPYMALPVYTAFRQIPVNLFDASADLGARTWRTVGRVALPMILPAILAGSVFTFSLSLGDFIVAQFVGGRTQMIGTVINQNVNLNPPLAAAFSTVPIAVIVIYLFLIRRTGALKEF